MRTPCRPLVLSHQYTISFIGSASFMCIVFKIVFTIVSVHIFDIRSVCFAGWEVNGQFKKKKLVLENAGGLGVQFLTACCCDS
jgi:hypothetical protein